MLLSDAVHLGQAIQADMGPFSERIMIAGSIRRRNVARGLLHGL